MTCLLQVKTDIKSRHYYFKIVVLSGSCIVSREAHYLVLTKQPDCP